MQEITIERDRYEAGYTKLEQLEALLACTTGMGFGHFTSLRESFQDLLLMLAADLAHEAAVHLSS